MEWVAAASRLLDDHDEPVLLPRTLEILASTMLQLQNAIPVKALLAEASLEFWTRAAEVLETDYAGIAVRTRYRIAFTLGNEDRDAGTRELRRADEMVQFDAPAENSRGWAERGDLLLAWGDDAGGVYSTERALEAAHGENNPVLVNALENLLRLLKSPPD